MSISYAMSYLRAASLDDPTTPPFEAAGLRGRPPNGTAPPQERGWTVLVLEHILQEPEDDPEDPLAGFGPATIVGMRGDLYAPPPGLLEWLESIGAADVLGVEDKAAVRIDGWSEARGFGWTHLIAHRATVLGLSVSEGILSIRLDLEVVDEGTYVTTRLVETGPSGALPTRGVVVRPGDYGPTKVVRQAPIPVQRRPPQPPPRGGTTRW